MRRWLLVPLVAAAIVLPGAAPTVSNTLEVGAQQPIVVHVDTPAGAVYPLFPERRGQDRVPAAVLTRSQIRSALAQFGWNEVVADWVATQVPFRVHADLARGWGLFYPGYYPDPGYVELAPDFKSYQIEHEARHAVYWAYGKVDRYGDDADAARADLAILEAVPGDVGAVARESDALHSDDWSHHFHRITDWLGRDDSLIPEPVRSRRFFPTMGGVAPKYRSFLPGATTVSTAASR